MVRSRGGASGSRGTRGRTVGRVERGELSHRVGPTDDDGMGRVFRRSGEVEAGEVSVAAPVGVISREGIGNSTFEGLSNLGIEMSLERRATVLADARESEVRILLAEGEAAWMAESGEYVALGRKRRERGRKRGGRERLRPGTICGPILWMRWRGILQSLTSLTISKPTRKTPLLV